MVDVNYNDHVCRVKECKVFFQFFVEAQLCIFVQQTGVFGGIVGRQGKDEDEEAEDIAI